MRAQFSERLEEARLRGGYYKSKRGERCGAFLITGPCGTALTILASDGEDRVCQGWEHVSVSTDHRCPNWPEM